MLCVLRRSPGRGALLRRGTLLPGRAQPLHRDGLCLRLGPAALSARPRPSHLIPSHPRAASAAPAARSLLALGASAGPGLRAQQHAAPRPGAQAAMTPIPPPPDSVLT